MGSVFRDDKEHVIMACSKIEQHSGDPLEIELLALFRGVQVCVPVSIQRLRIKSDSLLAVQAVDEGEESCFRYSNLIREIQTLKNCFMDCTFLYVSSLGNTGVAHKLARYAWQVEDIRFL